MMYAVLLTVLLFSLIATYVPDSRPGTYIGVMIKIQRAQAETLEGCELFVACFSRPLSALDEDHHQP